MKNGLLKVSKKRIALDGKPISLRGVNLGGWLMPEAYFMHSPNHGYRYFEADFAKACGDRALRDLEKSFRDVFIQDKDLKMIRAMGFNCVRLPFHYGTLEPAPLKYSDEGLGYIDRALKWAKDHDLKVILDMHAVPGAQNQDWHSDSDGRALFWTNKVFQRRAIALWEKLVDRVKDNPVIAGYDLLNESVVNDPALLNDYYKRAIKAIRKIDRQHIIFVEGNRWAQDIECLDDFSDDNLVLGIHFYEPLEFTFNYVPLLRYPLEKWDSAFMRGRLDPLKAIAEKRGRPLWCGEFGVNAREGIFGEDKWLEDILKHFADLDIHWNYWTWKAIKNHMFPDGIYSYIPNDPWICRQGPYSGWDTWKHHWRNKREEMIASWKTDAFRINKPVADVLKAAVKQSEV